MIRLGRSSRTAFTVGSGGGGGGAGIKECDGGADASTVRLLERRVLLLVASTLLVGCGSPEPSTGEPLSTPTTISPSSPADAETVGTALDDPGSSAHLLPAPLQFGPIADFAQGVNEINVPRRVFLIVNGSEASAFDRKDPNNGCALFAIDDQMRADNAITDPDAQFFDPCHGYTYDISGQPLCLGSRALWSIEIDVVDGIATWAGMKIGPNEPTAPAGAGCPSRGEH